MIVIPIEIRPPGQAASVIYQIHIWNDLTGTQEHGNYQVRLFNGPGACLASVQVRGHSRAMGALSLLSVAVLALTEAAPHLFLSKNATKPLPDLL